MFISRNMPSFSFPLFVKFNESLKIQMQNIFNFHYLSYRVYVHILYLYAEKCIKYL